MASENNNDVKIEGVITENKRILVIGGTGVGKSSIIKYCSGLDVEVGNQTRGVTKGFARIPRLGDNGIEIFDENKIAWFDSAGFGESKDGTVSTSKAMSDLIYFLKKNKNGFNGVLIVIKGGRTTQQDINLFETFKALIPSHCPKLLVITHSGTLGPDWLTNTAGNDSTNSENLDCDLGEVLPKIVVNFAQSEDQEIDQIFSKKREDSKKRLIFKISEFNVQYSLYTSLEGLLKIIKRTYNVVARAFRFKLWVDQKIKTMMKTLIGDDAEAERLTNAIENED
jgi:GTP-binding protein EngB required for normal cell division